MWQRGGKEKGLFVFGRRFHERSASDSVIKRISEAFTYANVFVLSRFDPPRQTYYSSQNKPFGRGVSLREVGGVPLASPHPRSQERNSGRCAKDQ